MPAELEIQTWENTVIWLRNQPSQRQLVLDAFSLAEHFDNRPGRLYSFVCRKARP
jgi:hypothetical protein